MKISKLLLLFIAITMYGSKLSSQTITFPDTVLRQKLLTSTATNSIAFDAAGNSIAIDSNTDGMITLAEASAVHRLNLRHNYANRIMSIEGLNEFDNLKSLDLYNNDISDPAQLYTLSTTLEVLDISFNRSLENQNLQFNGTNLSGLKSLKASAIGLSTINVTGLSNLEELDVSYNMLTSLNLTGCSNLISINASSNRNLNLPTGGITTLIYSIDDLLNVITLNISTNRLSTIQLADFPSLQTLYIYENDLTSLDVSSSYNLVELACDNNHIGSLNFGSINQLQYLSCSYNNINSLGVSNLTSLVSLSCSNNYLTNLDISNLITLTSLICSNNQLTTLDASINSQLSVLNCSNNNLSSMLLKNNGPFIDGESFGFANNPNLNYICEDASQISYINSYIAQYGYTGVTVDSNCGIDPPCTDLVAIPDPNFEQALLDQNIDTDGLLNGTICRVDAEAVYDILDVGNKNINDLTGIEAFVNIKRLFCINNNLTTLNLTGNALLTNLFCPYNNITTLDFTANPLMDRISASHNNIININVTNCPNLKYLDLNVNNLSSIDLSNNYLLDDLSLALNQLYNINVTNNVALTRFHISQNYLTSLNVSNNIYLKELSIGFNQISAINISQNTRLITLACQNNRLTSLNLNSNALLQYLFCYDNKLTSLNLSTNIDLKTIYCNNNNLQYLNLKNNTNNPSLTYIKTQNNPNLSCIMVDNVAYANAQPANLWTKDPTASYNTFCPSTPIAPGPIEPRFCTILKSRFTMEWAAWPDAQGYEVEVISSLARGVQTYRLPADQTILSIRKLGEMSWRVRPVINQQGIWSEWTYKCNGLEVIDILPIKQQSATGDTLSDISIYPNPVGQGNTLYINSPETLQEVTIYSVNGRVVYTKKGDAQEINTENLESGIYLIKIQTGQNSVTKKVIIE